MPDQQRVPIIMVTRNGLALTKNAVRSALAQDVPVDLLIVDNQSTDGTIEWLRSKAGISTIFMPKQMSLAACWNSALKILWKLGHDRALVINNDVVLRPDTVRLLNEHGGDFVTCVSVDSLDRIGTPGDRLIDDLRKAGRFHPDFSAFFIRKSVTDRVGWFNEECFPGYVEDSFFHVAMHHAGVKAVCIDLPFYHVGASTLKMALAGEALRIRRGADANRERFRQKYGCLPGSPEYNRIFES